jgi:hypothetical protein
MTVPYNNRLVLPDPPSRNEQALLLWANNHVVNGLLAGDNVTLEAVEQTLTPYNPMDVPDTGIVTINATGSGGGGYASLTGPGETTTPGDLTQAGGFTVNDSLGDGINFNSPLNGVNVTAGSFSSETTAGTGLEDDSSDGIVLDETGSGGILIQSISGITLTNGGTGLGILLNGGPYITVGASGDTVGFYGQSGITKPTITGSRGGNAALGVLLTVLQSMGLIVNSTTP